MSSRPSTPKQKKGLHIPQFLKVFGKSRSRSPSRSRPESAAGGLDEGARVVPGPSSVGLSRSDSAAGDPNVSNPSNLGSSGVSASAVPIIETSQPITIAHNTSLTSTSNHDHTPEAVIAGSGATPPVNITPSRGQTRNAAWGKLSKSLHILETTTNLFPPLSSAIGSLVTCLDGFETAARNREEFEDLATELTLLSDTLNQHLEGSASAVKSDAMESLAVSIKQRLKEVKERADRTGGGGIRNAQADEEELERQFRRIQSYFQRLQMNVTMSTWSIANDHLVKTRLESLSPVKQAAHDSSLPVDVYRQNCTEGTRIGILNGLNDWLFDPTSWSVYWMNGMAGTGKTTIASTFCERVENRKLLAASFFCTRSQADCKDVTRIVPTIAYQLALYSIPFRSELCQILEQNPDIGSKNILKQFEQLLGEPLKRVKDAMSEHLVVVIDALDECEDRNGVELILDMLFRYAPQVSLKFLVTSRPEPEIYDKMTTYAQSREVLRLHEIETSLVRSDIELYLKEELASISPGPTAAEIEQLVERSGTLFIYAATLVRYIHSAGSKRSRKRLQSVLNMAPEATKTHTHIDALYKAVLKSALNEDELEEDEVEDIRMVLRTVLLAQEPIGVDTISTLGGITDTERVVSALEQLRSVLYQSEQTGLVSALHASFPDFMFSKERSGSYFCDVVKDSQLLAERCFLAMGQELRFNICGLKTSFALDDQVEDLKDRVKDRISPALAYVCRHWANHISLTLKSDGLLAMLSEFLSRRLLFWMEVLSLRRELTIGVTGLQKVQLWLIHTGSSSPEHVLLVEDARNFLAGFTASPASQSTPHIYISLLPSCPRSSVVHKHYWGRTQGLLELKGSLVARREVSALATWTLDAPVRSVAYSPDGDRVAVGDEKNIVQILNAHDGSLLVGPLKGHNDVVLSVAFSPDGQLVASGSYDHTVRLWNSYNGTPIVTPLTGHTGSVACVSFSPDGARVVSCSEDRTIRIWSTNDGTLVLGPLEGHTDAVRSVAFSPDDTLVASGSNDKTIRLWSSSDGVSAATPFSGHAGPVECVVFTPDGTRLVSGSRDKTIRVWSVADGSLVTRPFVGHTQHIRSVAISPDGMRVVSGSADKTVRVWAIESGALVAGPYFGPDNWVNSLTYSPDGARVVSGSGHSSVHVQVWSVRDGVFLPPPLPCERAVFDIKSVAFTPDGSHLLSSSTDNLIRTWDPNDENGSLTQGPDEGRFPIPSPPISNYSPDRRYMTDISQEGWLNILNAVDGTLVAGPYEYSSDEVDDYWLNVLRFSQDSTSVIMGGADGRIEIRPLQAGHFQAISWVAHEVGVTLIEQSPDCSLLVSYSYYKRDLRIWNVVDPPIKLDFCGNSILAPSPTDSQTAVIDGWHVAKDGWVINSKEQRLLWLPPDLATFWRSPYASLIITRFGTLKIPKQKLLVGDRWSQCYVQD